MYVPFCGHAIIEAMSGVKTEVKDCMLTDVNQWGYHELQVHQVGREGGRGGREGRRKERREGRKEKGKLTHYIFHSITGRRPQEVRGAR